MYLEKLNEFLNVLEDKHLDMYFNISKDELKKYIFDLLNKYEIKNQYDFYYIANVIIKKLFGRFDSHTKLVWLDADFSLPVRFKYFNNSLYIYKTDDDNKDLLYGELLSINK